MKNFYLKEIAGGKRTIAVLGDMSLLGDNERELHSRMGDLVLKAGVDILVTLGDLAGEAAVRALQLGMSRERVFTCSNTGQAYSALLPYLDPECTVLLKKSMKGSFGNLVKKLTL